MSQQIQELIDKIKSEGIQIAEKKTQELEARAQSHAKEIVEQARQQADQLIREAKQEAQKIKETTQIALKHASRDMLLSLRREIEQTLNRIIAMNVSDTMTPENLTTIISALIKDHLNQNVSDNSIQVSLSSTDLERLKESFIAKLKEEIKQPIEFQSSENVTKGFTISFDNGKSCFEFTEMSLAEFLSAYLNRELASLLKEIAVS